VALVLFIIAGLDTVFAFIAQLGDFENDYQLYEAVLYILRTVPRRIYDFLSVATLIGSLIGLGILANSNELTVMRVAGVPVSKIVYMACKPVMLVVVFGLLLAQFVVPPCEQYAKSERTLQMDGGGTLQSRDGYWHREGDMFIHIKAMQPGGDMYGVLRLQFRPDQTLEFADYSDSATYQDGQWTLKGIRRTDVGSDVIQAGKLDTLVWDTSITPEILSYAILNPSYLSISGLYGYSRYLAERGLDSGPYYYAFWKKVLQPVAVIAMVFIAVSFIFGPLRSVTVGQRITVGLIAGLVFKYAQDFLGYVSLAFKVSPLLAAVVPIAICLLLGAYLLRRT